MTIVDRRICGSVWSNKTRQSSDIREIFSPFIQALKWITIPFLSTSGHTKVRSIFRDRFRRLREGNVFSRVVCPQRELIPWCNSPPPGRIGKKSRPLPSPSGPFAQKLPTLTRALITVVTVDFYWFCTNMAQHDDSFYSDESVGSGVSQYEQGIVLCTNLIGLSDPTPEYSSHTLHSWLTQFVSSTLVIVYSSTEKYGNNN